MDRLLYGEQAPLLFRVKSGGIMINNWIVNLKWSLRSFFGLKLFGKGIPANLDVEMRHGCLFYFRKGTKTLHRESGPAIEWSNGDRSWYIDGSLHRIDGPAVDWIDFKCWVVNGKQLECSSQKEFESLMKLRAFW